MYDFCLAEHIVWTYELCVLLQFMPKCPRPARRLSEASVQWVMPVADEGDRPTDGFISVAPHRPAADKFRRPGPGGE